MDTESVWDILAEIPVGVLIAWITVIGIIGGAIYAGITKLFWLFAKFKEKKEEYDSLQDGISHHGERMDNIEKKYDERINDLEKKIDNVIDILTKQNEEKRIEMRHSIVRAGEEALAEGHISVRKWKALHEMYDMYHTPDEHGVRGNGYVTTLIKKVDALPIDGKLDENDNDIP